MLHFAISWGQGFKDALSDQLISHGEALSRFVGHYYGDLAQKQIFFLS